MINEVDQKVQTDWRSTKSAHMLTKKDRHVLQFYGETDFAEYFYSVFVESILNILDQIVASQYCRGSSQNLGAHTLIDLAHNAFVNKSLSVNC